MDTVLITGGTGQLASALDARLDLFRALGLTVRIAGRPEFDFEAPSTIPVLFNSVCPALVVNAAAWTAVDRAEAAAAAAFRANRDGPAMLADLCETHGIPLIHLSTDYVFDGSKPTPYAETDTTGPTGVYGRSKLDGERAVLAGCRRAIVLRTSWVYSATGQNFVRTMLNAARKMDRLRVVADQHGCPTAAGDLADAVFGIIRQIRQGWQPGFGGVFHAAGAGATSWHGFATAIFEIAAQNGRSAPELEAITTADWPTPAQRPVNSELDCSKLHRVFGLRLPDWRVSLPPVVEQLLVTGA